MPFKLPYAGNAKNNKLPYGLAFFAAASLAAFPMLLFNGHGWYPSVDFFKWVLVFTVAGYGAGITASLFLGERAGVQLTGIELAWLILVLLAILQPLILPVRSFHEWIRNAYFFAALGGAVFMLRNLPIDDALPGILRAVTVTGGISTLIGYAQNSAFLKNIKVPFILDASGAPSRFLGNTGLDNILGACLALAVVAGMWLLLYGRGNGKFTPVLKMADFFFLALNCAGLWRAAARSAFIACAAGCAALFVFSGSKPGMFKKYIKILTVSAVLLICAAFIFPNAFQVLRRDMGRLFASETLSAGHEGRWAIWLTTWEMVKSAPLLGVGLGNYKWNYLDALAVSREAYPLRPRYTHWAHNEYFQWIAETGAVGGILFFSLLIYCVYICLRNMNMGNERKSASLVWSLSALAVLGADSCFSRPLHHADTAFTLPLAIAMISRLSAAPVTLSYKARAAVSCVMLSIALSGIVLFSQVFQDQGYIGKYFYNGSYVALTPSGERESHEHPLLLQDAYLRLNAKENYTRTLFGFSDAEQNKRDAIRLLTSCFETQPRYEELNLLMKLYQDRSDPGYPANLDEARRYFKYYPPAERKNFLEGRFDGKYMLN